MSIRNPFFTPAANASFESAVATIQMRRRQDSPLKRQMMEVASRYNGDYVIPLPDVEGEPQFPALAASIIADAVDGTATRANDTSPTILAPAVNPTFETSRERARTRRRAWAATWFESQIDLRRAKAFRQLMGYSTFCMVARPDFTANRVRIETRDPLTAYPETISPDEIRAPLDIGWVYGRSASWIIRHYPQAAQLITRESTSDSDMWDMVEWMDAENLFVGIIGKRQAATYSRRGAGDSRSTYGYAEGSTDHALLLSAAPNRAGLCTAVCPQAVTLDVLIASLKRVIPITDLLNKIAALDFIAAEKAVFPDMYAIGENGTPKIIGGQWADGRTGQINLLQNVKAIGEIQSSPGPMTASLMSYLERSARLSSGNTSLSQGELSGSVRSGQTIDQLSAFSVDPRIKEAHATMGYALAVMNEATAAIELAYWPQRQYTVFSGWSGDMGHVTYRPADVFVESKQSIVQYPMPGLDSTQATVALANAVGAKMMSRKTARTRHPNIDDPEVEERQIIIEVLEDAMQMAATQMVMGGQMALTDLKDIRHHVEVGMTLDEAVAKVQEEAQKRQADQLAAQQQETPPPGPEAMPGINGLTADQIPPELAAAAGAGAGGPQQLGAQDFLRQFAGALGGAGSAGGGGGRGTAPAPPVPVGR